MNVFYLRIDVPIDEKDILPAIVIEIDKGIAPTYITSCASSDSRGYGDIREAHPAVIAIKCGVFIVEVRYQQRHAPGVQIISPGNTHIGLPRTAIAQPHARREADFLENAPAVALVKIVWLAVVGHEEVQLAVVVEVGPDCSETIPMFLVPTPDLFETSAKVPFRLL